jgi:signal transduction histidine kinase
MLFKYFAIFFAELVIVNSIFTINLISTIMTKNGISLTDIIEGHGIPPLADIAFKDQVMQIIVGTIMIFVITATILRPIRRLIDASKKVAGGDLTVELPIKGFDEITELNKNFNYMVKQLAANEYLHKDFVSNVSHEFKTPITSLKGYAKLLKDPNLTSQKRNEYADIIIWESDRLASLSSNLLRLSELESDVLSCKKESFSLDEQIRDAVLFLQNEWESKNIELDLQLDEITFVGDKSLIYQVWINLFSNAVKYTAKDGKIKVNLFKKEKIVFEIIDNGIGISDDDLQNVFRKFYKADKSRNSKGTGLGLSIVKRIVELHKGTIYAESELGKGSKFTVIL